MNTEQYNNAIKILYNGGTVAIPLGTSFLNSLGEAIDSAISVGKQALSGVIDTGAKIGGAVLMSLQPQKLGDATMSGRKAVQAEARRIGLSIPDETTSTNSVTVAPSIPDEATSTDTFTVAPSKPETEKPETEESETEKPETEKPKSKIKQIREKVGKKVGDAIAGNNKPSAPKPKEPKKSHPIRNAFLAGATGGGVAIGGYALMNNNQTNKSDNTRVERPLTEEEVYVDTRHATESGDTVKATSKIKQNFNKKQQETLRKLQELGFAL